MKYKINLLSPTKVSLTDHVIHFALNYLRYILVITQIVVIGVFFYRFKVDQEIVDLKESLNQKREIVKVSQPLITNGKTLETKISLVKSIVADQERLVEMIEYLLSRFPDDFFLSKFTIDEQGIVMEGYSKSLPTVRLFYNRLKQEGKFQKIILKNVKKSDLGMEFSFELGQFKN